MYSNCTNLHECDISSSHGKEYEAQNLLGCIAVFLTECRLTFQRYVLPPSSGRSHIPQDSDPHECVYCLQIIFPSIHKIGAGIAQSV
jgi:hypothetical protein